MLGGLPTLPARARERCGGHRVAEKLYYTDSEIAVIFGVKESYLRKLRQLQAGPVYVRIGRMVRYRLVDVSRWLEAVAVEVAPKRAS
jgi:hypothetical protein